MNAHRELAAGFMRLPYHEKIVVARALGLNVAAGEPAEAIAQRLFYHARNSNQVDKLRIETVKLSNA